MSKRSHVLPKTLKKKPRLVKIRNSDLDTMVENIRLRAQFDAGKRAGLERIRKDRGFARAVVEHALHIVSRERAPLFRDAVNAGIRNREIFERKLRAGEGVWWDELLPLAPLERGHALKVLRKMWDIPDSEPITASPAPLH